MWIIYLCNSSLLNLEFSYCFWCWKSTREYQISNSRITRITNSLSLIQTWWAKIRTFSSGKSSGTLQKIFLSYNSLLKKQCFCFRYSWTVFICIFDCLAVNFGPVSRKKLQSPNANHCVLFIFNQRVNGTLTTRLGP